MENQAKALLFDVLLSLPKLVNDWEHAFLKKENKNIYIVSLSAILSSLGKSELLESEVKNCVDKSMKQNRYLFKTEIFDYVDYFGLFQRRFFWENHKTK